MKLNKCISHLFAILAYSISIAACGSSANTNSELSESPRNKQIIFQTNFADDVGYIATNLTLIDTTNLPKGWDGVIVTGNGSIEVIVDPAVDPEPVLKVKWDPVTPQPTARLFKHLTRNISTGYSELFIRYHIRLPNNFKAGNGQTLNHIKFGRLWQNTSPTITQIGEPGAWTENRADSGFVVWNFNSSPPFTNINSIWAANSGANLNKGSNGGERYQVDYFFPGTTPIPELQDGYFEHVGNGAWDFFTVAEDPVQAGFLKDKNQTWHTIEYRFKLATSTTSNDGIQQVWFDGVLQNANTPGLQGWGRIRERGGAPPLTGLPTAKRGSGFNMLALFDNLQSWNADWNNPGTEGFIYIKDVAISANRIGHEYIVSSSDSRFDTTIVDETTPAN